MSSYCLVYFIFPVKDKKESQVGLGRERESTGKHNQRREVWLWGRTDLQLVLQFDTSAESRAPAGTSTAGWQTAYPVSVSPPLPLLLPLPASFEDDEQMREWQGEWESHRAEEGERKKNWGRNVSSLPNPAMWPQGGMHYLHFSSPDHLHDSPSVRGARCLLGDLLFHWEKRPLFCTGDLWHAHLCITQTKGNVQDGELSPAKCTQ